MDDADDCCDAWDCEQPDELFGGGQDFADAAQELWQDEAAALSTAPEPPPMTPSKNVPPATGPPCGSCTAEASQASSPAASGSANSPVLPVVGGTASSGGSPSSAASAETPEADAKRRRLALKPEPQRAPALDPNAGPAPTTSGSARSAPRAPRPVRPNFGGADAAAEETLAMQGVAVSNVLADEPRSLTRQEINLVNRLLRRKVPLLGKGSAARGKAH